MIETKLSESRKGEAGFTLAEAMMATFILMFGLASIFNLMIVSVSSNAVGNRAATATSIASMEMERLRSTAFTGLTDSPTNVDTLAVQTTNFFRTATVEGVGQFETRWEIKTLTSPNLKYLRVRTEPTGVRGRQARAEFSSIRSCTTGTTAGCL